MNPSDPSYRESSNVATIAATFPDRDSAKDALTDLHHAGFRNVWLGVTHGDALTSGGATVASAGAGGGVMDSLGRFFSGEGAQEQALHQALIGRGLTESQARRLEASVSAGAAIVTVDGENDPDEAIDILQSNGGNVDASDLGSAPAATGSRAVAPQRSSRDDVDEARRLQLREERLRIDKQRVSSGEARVRKEVVSEQQSIDVPVFHEELFIQRRPVSEGSSSASPIDQSEDIRIPLNAERVNVQKQTFVTEEVEIGKRTVERTEHVSDTVRHEELRVDDADTGEEPRLRGR